MTDEEYRSETFRGGVHYAIAGLATTCMLYNALAYMTRKEPRLLVNVIVYSALLVFETAQTRRHWGGTAQE